MAEEKRSKLAAKLDEDLAEFVSKLKPSKYEDGWPEDKWEEEMEKHPFFMTKPLEADDKLPPLIEALQSLKYDPDQNTPEELALSYKTDGNEHFKAKNFRLAVAAYTEGLNANSKDADSNSQLFGNRAAAYVQLGNYGRALSDCEEAIKLAPLYFKLYSRGARCCIQLKKYDDALFWISEGLKVDSSGSELVSLRDKAEKEKVEDERLKQKKKEQDALQEAEDNILRKAIKKRGMRLSSKSSLNPVIPNLMESKVRLDESGSLIWPVVFLYPEHGVSDSIQAFHEDANIADHLAEMFNENNKPPWDGNDEYHADCLQAYFGDVEADTYVKVDLSQSLRTILCHKRHNLHDGTPCFFITVKDSGFEKSWLKSNNVQ